MNEDEIKLLVTLLEQFQHNQEILMERVKRLEDTLLINQAISRN